MAQTEIVATLHEETVTHENMDIHPDVFISSQGSQSALAKNRQEKRHPHTLQHKLVPAQ